MAGDPLVKTLQEKLLEIGFTFVGTPDGVIGARTRHAIREFQYYAGKANVAKVNAGPKPERYIDSLEATANAHRLPVGYKPNGKHDLPGDPTRDLIDKWAGANYR